MRTSISALIKENDPAATPEAQPGTLTKFWRIYARKSRQNVNKHHARDLPQVILPLEEAARRAGGGASPDRCIACHTVADIGRLTTLGAPVTPASGRPAFHASLASQDCMACHTDHPRPRLTRNLVRSFDHALLTPAVQPRCAACHTPPKDNFHRGVVPTCSQCHSTTAWKPATFDHDRYFSLRPPHDATCSTCHVGGNVQTYTCFGCHEHQKARIEARHAREGIRNIDNCVRCHRSAEGEGGEGEGRDGREGRE
jgi:hypothetical protein